MQKSKIMVVGSGAWGTAIANHLAFNNNDVYIYSIENDVINEINQKKLNTKYLPNINLHPILKAGSDFLNDMDFVFIVVPSNVAIEIFKKIFLNNFNSNCTFVICSKGFDSYYKTLLSEAFEKITKNKNYVVLSGPNFASEVAVEMPSITTIASENKAIAENVIKILNNNNFKAHYFNDPKTAEICGIVKNILAIGCGIVEGLGLGINTKSALIVKGINEIISICIAIKASTDLSNGAGFGDIFLTCSSAKSRNNQLGVMLANAIEPDSNMTFEGVNSAKIINEFVSSYNLKLDLCNVIANILKNKYSKDEIRSKLISAILS
jgi:glycerol-3-phosphate dehydrogenase (NAD(P)+)